MSVATWWGRTGERNRYTVGFVGPLRHVPFDNARRTSLGDEEHFAVGSGDSLPCGGSLVLARSRFQGARLRTFDGNDFFSFSIETDAGPISIVDEASGP